MTNPVGGQVWSQADFPCHTRYLALLGDGTFGLLSDPRGRGGMTCVELGGKWQYTEDEVVQYFSERKYSYVGKLHDLILEAM